jgi:hypothetical protein
MTTVAEAIARNHDAIVRSWTDAAQGSDSAKDTAPRDLVSNMSAFLSLLGTGGPGGLSEAQQALIERHMTNRLRAGYELNEILTGFAVLGRCVARFLETGEAGERPRASEVVRLFDELHLTTMAVTRIFQEHLLEDEQTIKRCRRMLQSIAGGGIDLGEDTVAIRSRLNQMVQLVAEATGASSAALLLFDVRSRGVTMTASAGAAGGALEQHARFLVSAAAPPGDLEASDEELTELPPSDALRREGVGSLIRVELAPRGAAGGILFLGLPQAGRFSASASRRLDGLSSALAVHVNNAQLQATLGRRIDELRAEAALREHLVAELGGRPQAGPMTAWKILKPSGASAARPIEPAGAVTAVLTLPATSPPKVGR